MKLRIRGNPVRPLLRAAAPARNEPLCITPARLG